MNKGPTLLDGDLPVSSLASCETGNGQPREEESAERESQGSQVRGSRLVETFSQLFLPLPPLAGVFGGTGEKRRCLRRSKRLGEKDRSVAWGLRRDRARTHHAQGKRAPLRRTCMPFGAHAFCGSAMPSLPVLPCVGINGTLGVAIIHLWPGFHRDFK